MAKDLRTFIADCERQLPGEVIHITKEVNPANYDVTAIIKHLGAQKKFPIIIFDNPLNLNGKVGPIKLTMNCEISQGKTQIALGMPRDATRPQMAEKCLEMEGIACRRRSSVGRTRRSNRTPWSVIKSIFTRSRSCAITKWMAVRISFSRPSPKTASRGSITSRTTAWKLNPRTPRRSTLRRAICGRSSKITRTTTWRCRWQPSSAITRHSTWAPATADRLK